MSYHIISSSPSSSSSSSSSSSPSSGWKASDSNPYQTLGFCWDLRFSGTHTHTLPCPTSKTSNPRSMVHLLSHYWLWHGIHHLPTANGSEIFWYSHCQMEKNAPQIIAVDENVHWCGCVTRIKGSWHHPGLFVVALNILSHYEISPASDLSASLEMKLGWVLYKRISLSDL